ncbi:autotransporter outer membrane beta-barrel domain-containing protein [Bartonella sp. HY038]|uniref:autotransporter family protein n=1 Tax=Bartonella sp. HY038 TaxID=2759660 RepID=UPI0015FBF74F|nr:autotransporter outer membrane beta-barrel domain-containing protein [Bartonella sp. HY038]
MYRHKLFSWKKIIFCSTFLCCLNTSFSYSQMVNDTIISSPDTALTLDNNYNGLTFENTITGQVLGVNRGILVNVNNTVSITNAGMISAIQNADRFWEDAGIQNRGVITSFVNSGTLKSSLGLGLFNQGTIGSIYNTQSGVISSDNTTAILSTGAIDSITNDGVISGVDAAIITTAKINTLTNSGVISGYNAGIQLDGPAAIDKIINNNIIEARGDHTTWYNAAIFTNGGTGYIGSIDNHGQLKSSQYGVLTYNDIGQINNYGTIETGQSAIIQNRGTIGVINNYGTIGSKDVENSQAIILNNINPIAQSNVINNYGTIYARQSLGIMVNNTNGNQNTVSINNYKDISGVVGIELTGSTGSVVIENSGNINGVNVGVESSFQNAIIKNFEGGVIQGGGASISVSANGQVLNYGSLLGEVNLRSASLYALGDKSIIKGNVIGDEDALFSVGKGTQTANYDAQDLTVVSVGKIAVEANSSLKLYDTTSWETLSSEQDAFKNLGTLYINGNVSLKSNVTNDGIISFSYDNTYKTLKIDGNYAANNGQIFINTVLGDSNSSTDQLHILGDATGSTWVNILNRNGIGALTTGNGINIIKVDGTSSADAFTLKSDYSFEGRSAIIAGAYAYSLYASDAAGNFDGNWYLRSLSTKDDDDTEDKPVKPVKPVYSATAPLYEAYPQILQQLNKVGTLEQRVGNRTWLNTSKDSQANTIDQADGRGFWMKIDGGTGHIKSDISKTNSSYDIDLVKTLLGLDFIAQETAHGKFIGGVYFQYGHAKADIDSRYGDGEITTDGYGFGGTLTWYGANGLYVDGVAQVMFYDSDIRSNWLENGFGKRVVDGNRGRGYALSIEAGKKIALNQEWAMTPQVQLSYNDVDFNSFNDNYGGHVNAKDGNALTGRLGMQFDREVSWKTSEGDLRRLKAYGIGNLYYDFLNGTNINLTGVNFRNRSDRFWGGLGTGISYNWKDDAFTIYSEIDARTSFTNFSDSYSFNGTVGFKARF